MNKKEAILEAFPRRLQNSREQEIEAALNEIFKIADLRLKDLGRRMYRRALTTHVLDTSRGSPAAGMDIEVWSIDPSTLLKKVTTNSDGRVDAPLLSGPEMKAGTYELVFLVGDYFRESRFLNRVPVRFTISDANAK